MARSKREEAADSTLSTVDALAQLSFVIQGILGRRAAAHDLSLIQTRLLGILRDREPTMLELARLLELDKSSVTGLVDRASRRGLVTRVPSEHDRRAAHVTLTDTGRAAIASIGAAFETDIRELVAGIRPVERAALRELVGQVLTAHATRHGIDLSATLSPPR